MNRTAKVSRVINGWRVDFYKDTVKHCNWFTSDMEEADAWADAWKDRGALPASAGQPEAEQ